MFAWRHFYQHLTDRNIWYLHPPPEIIPATLCCSCPETGRPLPTHPECDRPVRVTGVWEDGNTYRRALCPLH
ncbi:40S ribosomal protein S10 [Lemmus lemmus]